MTWQSLIDSGLVRTNVGLDRITTYKLGGPAEMFAEINRMADLDLIAAALAADPKPVLVLGRGSNLVIADEGISGVVIQLGHEFSRIEVSEMVHAGGGAGMPQVARAATKAGRLGLEFLVGIPGSVGGGVRQNAGCFGQEIVDVLVSAVIYDLGQGRPRSVDVSGLDLSYRHSAVGPLDLVIGATFLAEPGEPTVGDERIRAITRWRRDNQPGGTLNAGSVFKNPPGDSAGRIIDAVGLKGLAVGGASVSERHANFFVAMPGARAVDVYRLVREVAARVEKATGIVLETEIQFAGAFESD
ncbi:MAG TPA: UDP-N-acetylmuramate dehydrogenase [Acidimicrobiia bacterium]|nr:UDP-N-acetylmuramate dehydrogenase [Acidimicrobiia bacterium]